jgi:hypothetical protein
MGVLFNQKKIRMKYAELIRLEDLSTLLSNDFDGLEYIYRGHFENAISQQILSMAEKDLDTTDGREAIKKRIFFIMVEGLQNITRHQEVKSFDKNEYHGAFFIQRQKEDYIMTTGNIIENKEIKPLTEKLEKINSLDINELKKYYLERLKDGEISNKGGAGLGLIEMARKSGNKLVYDFMPIDKDNSFFYFQTVSSISSKKGNENAEKKMEAVAGTLDYIKNMHKILNKYSVQLQYKGNFSQSSILNLLGILQKNKIKNKLNAKVSNIMIEMLQNVAKHGANRGENGTPACFYLMENQNNITLFTSNFVRKEDEEELIGKIEFVNSLSKKELNDYYNRVLLYFDADEKRTGLGFLDIRLKSDKKIMYKLTPYNKYYSIYSIYIDVSLTNIQMNALIIEATEETPQVNYNPANSKFIISQRSLPENAIEFYDKIYVWLDEYSKNPNPLSFFEFNFEYFNTASSKQIIKIMLLLEKMAQFSEVKVKWFYHDYDEDMLQNGQRFASLVDLDFELIELTEDVE